MKLQRAALIAEIVGGFGILVTLVILVFEVRSNTAVVLSSTYDQLYADHIQWRMDMATNPQALGAFVAFADPSFAGAVELDELTAIQGRFIWMSGMMIWERAYFAHEYGNLGDSEWQRYRSSMCSPEVSAPLQEDMKSSVSEEFWSFLTSCISDAGR